MCVSRYANARIAESPCEGGANQGGASLGLAASDIHREQGGPYQQRRLGLAANRIPSVTPNRLGISILIARARSSHGTTNRWGWRGTARGPGWSRQGPIVPASGPGGGGGLRANWVGRSAQSPDRHLIH